MFFNKISLEQNGWHFAGDIYKYIFDEELCINSDLILIQLSLKFVPKRLIDNK